MLVDSHCHLDFPELFDDLDAVVARARAAGVGVMQTICTRLSRFEKVLGIARRYDDIYCSVGVHPHDAAAEPGIAPDRIVALTGDPKVIGIGETGLDYYYENSPRAAQQESFRTHIAAARETGLPLIVHSRDADADTAAILEDEMRAGAFTGLIHCFSTGLELAERAIGIGFYISVAGIVTFKNAEGLRDTVRDLPLDRLLVETDAPYLAPAPRRGKPNEPAFVVHTAECIARLKGISDEAFAAATTENFFRLFKKPQRDDR